MLAKHPGQRPPDASAVLEEIVRLQSGDSSQFVIHPVLPAHEAAKIFQADYEWELESNSAALWPLVIEIVDRNCARGHIRADGVETGLPASSPEKLSSAQ